MKRTVISFTLFLTHSMRFVAIKRKNILIILKHIPPLEIVDPWMQGWLNNRISIYDASN